MKREICIHFFQDEDVILKYDPSKLSSELLEFILKKAMILSNKDTIKIVINNHYDSKIDIKALFYNSFKEELENIKKKHFTTNIFQFGLFLLGFIFLFLSFRTNDEVWQEIFLIGGWVPIWEMIDLELFHDVKERRRKKTLLRLLNSEIIINNN